MSEEKDPIQFDWDPMKAKSNLKKHGISFSEAQTVFYDTQSVLLDDPDHSDDEERFLLIGMSSMGKICLVCHCYREGGVIRIISARKANEEEVSFYARSL